MKLLADANIESAIVRWLRSSNYDVIWAAELPPSTPDAELIDLASRDRRLLLTYDRDFGELVFNRRLLTNGIVLLRFYSTFQAERLALLQFHWLSIETQGPGNFVVVSERNLRIRPLP